MDDRAKRRVWEANYRERHREEIRVRAAKYRADHKDKHLESCARYTAGHAAPKWLTQEQIQQMRKFYEHSSGSMHVDHIIPLNTPTVSGLHVPWNLQLLSCSENTKKGVSYEQ